MGMAILQQATQEICAPLLVIDISNQGVFN
jgi:hypothetical protein